MMTRILLCFCLLSISYALKPMDRNRSISGVIQFGEQQEEKIAQTYWETFNNTFKTQVSDMVFDAVVKTDCISEVTNRELIQGGQERSRFGGGVRQQTERQEAHEFGEIYGRKMKEYGGNILKAFPDAVEEHCFKIHTTDDIARRATAIADKNARNVTAQNLKNVVFPRTAVMDIASQGIVNVSNDKAIKLDSVEYKRISSIRITE